MNNENKQIPVYFPNEIKGGAYANNMQVNHTKEEFILDFMLLAPLTGAITSRVIISPGHMKRVLKVLQDNFSNYEKAYGQIESAQEPKTQGQIGFIQENK